MQAPTTTGNNASGSVPVQLSMTRNLVQSLAIAKVFRQNKKPISSLDFDDSGEYCVTASEDESLCLYDCTFGTNKKVLFSKKYGVQLCKFAHSQNTVIHSSTKEDDTIRYLSLHDNKYIRYFKGHKQRYNNMDDLFLSGAMDDTVRLWDLRSPNCQGLTNVHGYPCVAFDPLGVVFAVGLDDRSLRFYDLRNFDKGPFEMMQLPASPVREEWTGIKFSNNGRDLLISTRQERLHVIDSVNYTLQHTLTDYENKTKLRIEASFTPDGEFIVSGAEDGKVHVWSVESGEKVAELEGHTSPCRVVQFNPRLCMMASGCMNLAFWLPIPRA